MQDSDLPANKFQVPFGNSATSTYIRTVPETTTDANAASFDLGFPPNTFTPLASGGAPPDGRDVNGILNAVTAWLRWYQAGGPLVYDSAFQTAIGGYPNGAIVGSAVHVGSRWLSTADNNTTNPDTGGAGWLPYPNHVGITGVPSSISITVPLGVSMIDIWDLCGGGGGGGGSYGANSGASGGAGNPWLDASFAVKPGDTLTFSIGASAGGGTAGNPAGQGGTGGTTTVSLNGVVMITATGGTGGLPGTLGLQTSVTSPGTISVSAGVTTKIRPGASGQLPFNLASGTIQSALGGAPGGGGYSAFTVSSVSAAGQSHPSYGGGGGGGVLGGTGGTGGAGFCGYSFR